MATAYVPSATKTSYSGPKRGRSVLLEVSCKDLCECSDEVSFLPRRETKAQSYFAQLCVCDLRLELYGAMVHLQAHTASYTGEDGLLQTG